MKPLLTYSCALLVFSPLVSSADTIVSINIAGGNEDAPGTGVPAPAGQGIVTGAAGIDRLENWNNAIGTSGTIPVVNSTGSPSGASVTWVTNNTWSTQSADGAGSDADMMSGYLDNFDSNGSIVVEDLGSEFTETGYEVRVYFQNDNDDNNAGFTAIDNLGNTDTRYGYQLTANNNWPLAGPAADPNGYIVSVETDPATLTEANVVLLTGLSGPNFTLTGVAGAGAASTRARPNAIQIITTGNPLDNDMDTLPDDWEIANGLDPNDDGSVDINNGPDGDPDLDLLLNRDEFGRGTDPQDPDSDDDDLTDKVEDNTGTYVDPTQTGSNPLNPDTDADTLTDGAEVEENPYFSDPNDPDTDDDGLADPFETEANPYVTNPALADTDNDTWSDKVEIDLGSDPTNPQSVPDVSSGPRIGINFTSDRDNAAELGVDEIAGIAEFAHSNWNNIINIPADGAGIMGDETGINSPTAGEVTQSDGSTLADVTVNWSSVNAWNAANGTDNPDNKLMNGYIDNNGDNPDLVQIDVANLPSNYTSGSGYTVIAYFGSDGNGRTGTIGVTGSDTFSFSTDSAKNGDFPNAYVQTTDTGAGNPPSNYARWDGLKESNLEIRLVRGNNNSGIHGIQIISTEPAVPLEITDFSYDAETNMVSITWNSEPGTTYAIDFTTDLQSWPGDIDDSIVPDETSTTVTFEGPPIGTKRIYYRVRVSE